MTGTSHGADVIDLLKASNVEIDASTRRVAEYSYDASNYRVAPLAVAFPRNAEEVSRVVGLCQRVGVPIIARAVGHRWRVTQSVVVWCWICPAT